ncbi:hypothetical protein [Luedemannella helvata]|uniref:Uncharacterized protein n=1 Tax=Luedemannella helvata TaxID=349315 RepID=A0ABP4XGN5_9ACTN
MSNIVIADPRVAAVRRAEAHTVYEMLRHGRASGELELFYDGAYQLIAKFVWIDFTTEGVELAFPTIWGRPDNGALSVIKISAPYRPGAVATLVEGILAAVMP